MIKHIGIILDGNRRFAKRLMKSPWKGHEWGAGKIRKLLEWCRDFDIKYVTLYTFSIQNFSRPKKEFDFLMKLLKKEALELLDPEHDVHKYKIRFKAIGRVHLFPKDVQEAIRKVENATKNYNNYFVNVAAAYGGQEEITDAVIDIAKKISKGIIKVKDVNEKLIRHSLYTDGTPYPELIIRTGGEKRLSNFLLWQSAYSELMFIDKLWPEFNKKDFTKCIKEFEKRERRFGH
jgi:tritrans,polycis-undecaprenyl-diphosphate synthase [geranylgeranyl-diphosphate specific]